MTLQRGAGVDAPLKYTNKTATLFSNMSKIAEGEIYRNIQEEKREQFSGVSPIKLISRLGRGCGGVKSKLLRNNRADRAIWHYVALIRN